MEQRQGNSQSRSPGARQSFLMQRSSKEVTSLKTWSIKRGYLVAITASFLRISALKKIKRALYQKKKERNREPRGRARSQPTGPRCHARPTGRTQQPRPPKRGGNGRATPSRINTSSSAGKRRTSQSQPKQRPEQEHQCADRQQTRPEDQTQAQHGRKPAYDGTNQHSAARRTQSHKPPG